MQAAVPSAPGLVAAVRITSHAVVDGGGRGERVPPGPRRHGGGGECNLRALRGSVGFMSPCPRRVVSGAQEIECNCKAPVNQKGEKQEKACGAGSRIGLAASWGECCPSLERHHSVAVANDSAGPGVHPSLLDREREADRPGLACCTGLPRITAGAAWGRGQGADLSPVPVGPRQSVFHSHLPP